MKKVILVILGCITLASCTVSGDDMKRLMKQEGVTDYQFTGYDAFACAKDDDVSTGFFGTKNGQKVSGVVCGGLLLKGYTIRYR